MEFRTTSDLVVGAACTLLIAATGGILAARRAGSQAASIVTSTPTANAAATAVGETISGPAGVFAPKADIAERSPVASPSPRAKPTTDASAPTTSASSSTERLTWRREAPTARISASSLVRWATSMVKVLEIRKMPTKSAIAAKASSTWLSVLRLSSIILAWSSASSSPVWASAPSGSSGFTASSSCCSDAPAAAVTVTSLKWPGAR